MKKSLIFILALLGIAFIFRLCLPYALLHYATNRLNKIPEYRVEIKDLDLHLYRGSYSLKEVALYKINKNIPVPFFSAKTVDLAVEWRALLQGAFVAKIKMVSPIINVVLDPKGKDEQVSIDKEWQKAVRALFPLNFNRIEIENGKLSLRSFHGKPPFNIFLQKINLVVENLQGTLKKTTLLSSNFYGDAKAMDGSPLHLKGQFDPFSHSPTFKLEGSLKSMQIKSINEFLKHYTNVDVKQGQFSLFVEAASANGVIKGEAKPIIKNLKILDPQKKNNPIEFLYKGALDLVAKIMTNSEKKTIATKVKIEGSLEDPDTSTLSIIGYLLRHAFINALLPQVDHNISMRDVLIGKSQLHSKKILDKKR